MKAALIVLVCAAIVFFLAFSRPSVQFRVSNISEIDKPTDIEITIDRKPVFNDIVGDVSSKFRIKLAKGKHYLVVRGNKGGLVQTQQFTVTGKTRIEIRYKASYSIDQLTRKPVGNDHLDQQIFLSIADWDYPNDDVYAEIPTRKKKQ